MHRVQAGKGELFDCETDRKTDTCPSCDATPRSDFLTRAQDAIPDSFSVPWTRPSGEHQLGGRLQRDMIRDVFADVGLTGVSKP